MKKRIFSFLMIFMALFMVDKMSVSATKVCSYGVRTGDDPNTWSKRIEFEVEAWNKVYINAPQSPYLSNVYNLESVTGQRYDYKGKVKVSDILLGDKLGGLDDGDIYLYISLYPTETVYNNLKGECPKILNYKQKTETVPLAGGAWAGWHLGLYNDDLDKKSEDYDWFRFINDDYSEEGVFIEESQKDAPLADLVDNYGCITYSSSLDEIKKTAVAKSCDNNPDFNYKYQELSQICESYRSTALYATDDGDKIMAKSCQKACSRLKDDIAGICNAAPDGGYCGSLGNKVVNWIFRIVRIVRYAIPVLLILLSILDYIKALAADNEDEMKKVTSRFVRRLIAAALIFIVPFILDFILRIFNIPGLNASNPFCAK